MRTVESKMEELTTDYERMEKVMQESVDHLKEAVDTSLNQALARLKDIYQGNMDRYEENLQKIVSIAGEMSEACETADKARQISNPVELLGSQHQILDRLNRLENLPLPEIFGKTNFVFEDRHHLAMAKIEKSLQDLCAISPNVVSHEERNRIEQEQNQIRTRPTISVETTTISVRKARKSVETEKMSAIFCKWTMPVEVT